MIFNREWAMPNSDTFSVKPIGDFVRRNMYGVTVDPFARDKDWFTWTNDLNPNTKAAFHMDAEDFLVHLSGLGVIADVGIFDPPYSPRQISECYSGIGRKPTMKDTQSSVLYKRCRAALDMIIPIGGKVLSFGWNSVGMGKHYETEEILLVCHGGAHNDTICLCQIKIGNRPINKQEE